MAEAQRKLLKGLGAALRPALQPWWIATAVLAAGLAWGEPLLQRANALAFDLWVALVPASAADDAPDPPRQVIVAIDDASLQRLGRWPWPRELHAQLIDRLREGGSLAVGYDVMFSEPSDPPASGDAVLAAAVARHGHVILPVMAAGQAGGQGTDLIRPLPALENAAAGLGHTLVEPDADLKVRRLLIEWQHGDTRWPAMPLAVHRILGGAQVVDAPPSGAALMPAGGPSIAVVSAAQLLQDPHVPATFDGAIVWVGVTAQGSSPTISAPAAPTGQPWHGIQWQAHAYSALREGRLILAVDKPIEQAVTLLPLLCLAVARPFCRRNRSLRGRWVLPVLVMPTLASLAALALFATWIPTVGLTAGLMLGLGLYRARDLSRARSALQQARGQADATLQAITDGVVTVDTAGRVQYINPSAERLAGCSLSESCGRYAAALFACDAEDAERLQQALTECLSRQRVVAVAGPLRIEIAGGARDVQLIASPVVRKADASAPDAWSPARTPERPVQVCGAVLVLCDVTDRQRAAARLRHEATHDALTGLPNRAALNARLQAALAGAGTGLRRLALLFIDLDRFKRINDSLGHRHGDTVLQIVATRLGSCCRPQDTLGRWGGDEFVMLIENPSDQTAVAAVAMRLIDRITREVTIDGMEVACGCSIGIAMGPDDAETPEGLLALADAAMFRAKAQGGQRFEFHAGGEEPAWTRERLALETRLRRALLERRFVLHYQPQVDLRTGQLVGLEALLRWEQPDGELWPPGRFLGVLEETGLIVDLGEWAIREATSQVARWRDLGLPLVPVSVNVSTRQCRDARLVQVIRDALRSSGVPAGLLKLEVTESTAIADLGRLRELLIALRALGVQVAMDDFGTGFSSLSHLRQFRVDQIKIDPSFVRDISRDDHGAAIVRATIALAHGLGLPVVAEGVESAEQLRFLSDHGCDMAQGYLYARAQDNRSIAELLRLSLATGTPLQQSRWRAIESVATGNLAPA